MISTVLLALIVQSPPDTPRRVVPGEKSETHAIYRQVKPGEERIDALLQRIVCPPGKPVTFMLKGKDNKVVRFTAPTLTSVDYIAHNPDFRGPVSCGGYTPPEHVLLTSKKLNGAVRVVAIEFLPR